MRPLREDSPQPFEKGVLECPGTPSSMPSKEAPGSIASNHSDGVETSELHEHEDNTTMKII